LTSAHLAAADSALTPPPPNILLITVDTLRADHLSGYGYARRTSPNLDHLMAEGVRFDQARTVVALTCPSLSSMLTTLGPHEHGSTRNGLRTHPRLPSLPKVLRRQGYATAAFVSNWMLTQRMCGLGEHFQSWVEVLERRRLLFGRRESTADDVNEGAIAWLEDHVEEQARRPFLLWVHYMEPHFPYRVQQDFLRQLGLGRMEAAFSARDRYDSEIAYVDSRIGLLLESVRELVDPTTTVVLFASDHGESLGHHGYWGHGKHVYDAGLRIPLSVTWPGRIEPGQIAAPALLTDVGATLLGLGGIPSPGFIDGFDWSPVILGEAPPPTGRATYSQAHRGTVKTHQRHALLRRKGLLEVGRVQGARKEVLVVGERVRRVFDLAADPAERHSLVDADSPPSDELLGWLAAVRAGIERSDALGPPNGLDEQSVEKLQALGYID
jgi:arylsulfatase A-like enzyme